MRARKNRIESSHLFATSLKRLNSTVRVSDGGGDRGHVKSQKVFSLRRQLMRPPSVAKGDVSLGGRRKQGEGGWSRQTRQKPGGGNGGPRG